MRKRRLVYPSAVATMFLYDKKGNIIRARLPRVAQARLNKLAKMLMLLDVGLLCPSFEDSVRWLNTAANRRKRGRTLKWAPIKPKAS